jgi:hypothetical protein
MGIHERFEAVNEDYIKFDRVENKRSQRPDLHAYLLLDEIFPSSKDMVCAASHDEIWLDVEGKQLEKLTDEQILELTRCGVRHCNESDSLAMFV